jgi:hypothetical protein
VRAYPRLASVEERRDQREHFAGPPGHALMPFAGQLDVVTAQTSLFDDGDRLVAQTTQIQAVRAGA